MYVNIHAIYVLYPKYTKNYTLEWGAFRVYKIASKHSRHGCIWSVYHISNQAHSKYTPSGSISRVCGKGGGNLKEDRINDMLKGGG